MSKTHVPFVFLYCSLFFFFFFQINQQKNNPKAQTVASGQCSLPTDHVALVFTASSIVHCWNNFGRTSSLSTQVGAFILLTDFLKKMMVQSQFSNEKSGGGGGRREEKCKQNFYPTRTLFSLVPLSILTKLAHLASDANHPAWPLHEPMLPDELVVGRAATEMKPVFREG